MACTLVDLFLFLGQKIKEQGRKAGFLQYLSDKLIARAMAAAAAPVDKKHDALWIFRDAHNSLQADTGAQNLNVTIFSICIVHGGLIVISSLKISTPELFAPRTCAPLRQSFVRNPGTTAQPHKTAQGFQHK